ncbi:MAG: glycosyltransferase, partial [Balneolaceae bacterium]
GVIVVSQELMGKLKGHYGAQHLYCVPNGVDLAELTEKANAGTDLSFQADCQHIAIIGRLVSVKRVDLFLETARLVLDRSTKYRFHIVGDGPLEKTLKEQAATLELTEPYMQFHGHRTDIPAIIQACDAVVLCSDHEGMPMVALETLGLGKVLLATHTVCLAQNGVLTGHAPVAQTSNALCEAIFGLQDKSTHQEPRQYRFKLTIDQCAKQTIGVYCYE